MSIKTLYYEVFVDRMEQDRIGPARKFKIGDWVEKTGIPAENSIITYISEYRDRGYKLAYTSAFPHLNFSLGACDWYDSELRLLSGRQTVLDV